ncbi:hypothetical protein FD19_GL000558 [Lacticaseibacillus thailandensis DSM 22698 = JCM 13996]|uniref:Uncharacterized protein n=1 Tax=Lacticaseibacillus thailandensis DSM 22698 = JCM 13996 TaxID=1423810 RepID=A0A0R2CIL0_9LACO|nr:hypothetical protein FD19_GL000558 [Lacticaseibacillus thailandensis DSM 22698 = JCM 13996]
MNKNIVLLVVALITGALNIWSFVDHVLSISISAISTAADVSSLALIVVIVFWMVNYGKN